MRVQRNRVVGAASATLAVMILGCSDGGGGGTTPPPTGAIAGAVTADGSGVASVAVALTGPATASTTTSDGGEYRFDNLAAGQYGLEITPPSDYELASGQTAVRTAQVQAGQTARVDWELSPLSGGEAEEVQLSGVSFAPSQLTVARGSTVRWVVVEGSHTVTPDDPDQPGAWTGTGLLDTGDTFEYTFDTAGTYHYHCQPHRSAGMAGTIVVQ